MGFDVLYFPPIHPIGTTNRKGTNNSAARASRTTSAAPMRSAASEGGHDAIHPAARHARGFPPPVARGAPANGLELALDFAIQCSPDHPWLKEHPDWFRWRARRLDPLRGESAEEIRGHRQSSISTRRPAIPELWLALRDVVLFWIDEGVRIFRVDNPHTKPLPFWEWLIADVRGRASRRDLPGGGLHAAEDDVPPGQGRLLPVLHLFHLAQHQAGADRVLDRADDAAR